MELGDGIYFDILKEIGNIGAGNAVTALSLMLGEKVDMNVPLVSLIEFKEMAEIIGSAEDLVFGILMNLSGDINAMMIFLVRTESARAMITSLLGEEPKIPASKVEKDSSAFTQEFSDIDISALKEIGNILISSYTSALSSLTGKKLTPSVPYLSMDMAGAILSVPAIEFGKIGDKALLIESIFGTQNDDVSGYFILVPEMGSVDVILKSLGVS